MRYKLKGRGPGPHAIVYRHGQRLYDMELEDGEYVEDLAEAERVHAPAHPNPLAGDDDTHQALTFAGIYRVRGNLVAALYGCELEPIDGCPEGP
jgi:hypothetical protein